MGTEENGCQLYKGWLFWGARGVILTPVVVVVVVDVIVAAVVVVVPFVVVPFVVIPVVELFFKWVQLLYF